MATERSKKAKALANKAKNFVMLAHKYSPTKHIVGTSVKRKVDITGWGVYEKIDGVRAIFTGGKLLSRYGNKFHAPKEFINEIHTAIYSSLDNTEGLDGELVSIKGFQHTTSIVRDQSEKATMEYWKNIRYVIFDLHHGNQVTFSDRFNFLVTNYKSNNYVKLLHPLGTIKHDTDVDKYHNIMINKGKEGLILRNPKGLYTLGRSWDVLKVKSFSDIEVTVVSHLPGEGKHANRLGKLICKLPNGKLFECGTGFSDAERENPPSIGSKITVKYFEYTDDGIPRFPIFVSNRDYE